MPEAEGHELPKRSSTRFVPIHSELTELLRVDFIDHRNIIHMQSLHGPSTRCGNVEEANRAHLRLRFSKNVRYKAPLDNVQRGGDVALRVPSVTPTQPRSPSHVRRIPVQSGKDAEERGSQ